MRARHRAGVWRPLLLTRTRRELWRARRDDRLADRAHRAEVLARLARERGAAPPHAAGTAALRHGWRPR
jgi:hypothetical protein